MKYLSIKSFDDLQHYKRKDWSPPWIKLYNRLLDDYRFAQMSETAQLHLIKLWLLASRNNNRIPNDLSYISRAINARTAVDLDELIVAGFVIPTDEPPARKVKRRKKKALPKESRIVLEESYKESTPDKRRKEKSREEKKKPSGGWVGRFGQAFAGASGGIAPLAEIGRFCKPLVERDGEEITYARWETFCASERRKYGPAHFSKHAGDFDPPKAELIGVGGNFTPEELRRAGIFLS